MKLLQLERLLVLGLVLFLGACSSEQTKESEPTEAPPAATDAVPPPPSGGPEVAAGSPAPPPAPEAPPSNSSAATSQSSPMGHAGEMSPDSYTVQKGDTLMKIAFEIYGEVSKWRSVYETNKGVIKDPNSVPAGVNLKVMKPATPILLEKNGERYLIKKGDTLGKISTALYGVKSKWKEIWQNNKQLIRNPNRIFAGFFLYYTPGALLGSNSSNRRVPASAGSMPGPLSLGNLLGGKTAAGGVKK